MSLIVYMFIGGNMTERFNTILEELPQFMEETWKKKSFNLKMMRFIIWNSISRKKR